jgi:cation-transporting P-type ATPase F
MTSSTTSKSSTDRQWYQQSAIDVAKYLSTDLGAGLSSAAVAKLQERYGFNELQGKPGKNVILRFLMEFNQPLIYLLLLAGTVALLLQEWVDAGAIFTVTLINATIGFIQESKAENAIAALAKSVTTEATVIRDAIRFLLDS